MDPSWPDDYPDKTALKREARAMAEAFAEALLAHVPSEHVAGIYWKGSAQKEWTTPIDYVPELSDVDIHVLFADDSVEARYLGAAEQGLRVQEDVECRYCARVPKPIHMARPQLMVLNRLLKDPDYVGPATGTVTTLFGRQMEHGGVGDPARARDIARRQLLGLADAVRAFPMQVVDKPGKLLWQMLRQIVWQVSPTGPKVLVLDGADPDEAWALNRTGVVLRLESSGRKSLAGDYARFYLAEWDYFKSGYADNDAAREALAAGVRVMSEGSRIAAAG